MLQRQMGIFLKFLAGFILQKISPMFLYFSSEASLLFSAWFLPLT